MVAHWTQTHRHVSFVILRAFGLSLGRARVLVLCLVLDLRLRFIVGLISLGLGAFGFRIGTVNGHGGCIWNRQIDGARGCGPQPLLKYSGHWHSAQLGPMNTCTNMPVVKHGLPCFASIHGICDHTNPI